MVPKRTNASRMPSTNPKSPMRLTMKAFLPASEADVFWNQKPMSRYEQRPTPSQPTNITRKFEPRTSTSMNEANRFRYEKYRAYSLSASSCMYAVEYTWMSDPIPVTTRIITADSGSSRNASATEKSPEVSHVNARWTRTRLSGSIPTSLTTAATEMANDISMAPHAIAPAALLLRRRPKLAFSTKPMSGRSGI